MKDWSRSIAPPSRRVSDDAATGAFYQQLLGFRLSDRIVCQFYGFDVDITYALCKQMGVECTISNQSFDGLIPAAETSTSRCTHVGSSTATAAAMKPPIELPTSVHPSTPIAAQNSPTSFA